MAISKRVQTYGLLNAWPEIMQEDIWRFNQVTGQGSQSSECDVYIQPDREHIAVSLRKAWDRMSARLGFFPRPIWHEERLPLGKGKPWSLQTLTARYGYIEAFGQRTTSVIQAGAAVVYSDADGDGVNDTATISVTTSVDSDEIQVFFQTADGAPEAGHELYQIEPLNVVVSGGAATITGPRALFVKPSTVWNVPYEPGDPNKRNRNKASTTDASDFVTAVDVYRVYADPATAVEVIADPIHIRRTDLGGDVLETGVARLTNARLGIFEARIEDCTCLRYAEAVKVYYKAGYPLEYGQIEPTLLDALIRLANTYQGRKLCSFCDQTENLWAEDRYPPGDDNPATQKQAENPFGAAKGQIDAWRTVCDFALARGGAW